MKIEGVGTIKKEEAMKILTSDGKRAVREKLISDEELGAMYKLELTKNKSKIGRMGEAFNKSYSWIPEGLKKKLSPEELGTLTDAFYGCYGSGKKEG